eukprot:TRINITY_DN5425_c0_g4_i1.p1 TRINITY_DN5425_c0_g4~~TRINITY_DN5425_c0_g4_i1.p1  ORF type:complete len:275 (+),score=64.98 TRINITY_DN5425_c0_g4_i1:289-1113(+)
MGSMAGAPRWCGKMQIDDTEVAELRRLYDQYTGGGRSGGIDFQSFVMLSRKVGVEAESDEVLRGSMCECLRQPTDSEVNVSFGDFMTWLSFHAEKVDENAVLKAKVKSKGKKPLGNSQIASLRNCFNQFDADGSGAIDIQEMVGVFKMFGEDVSEAEVNDMMLNIDEDGSGEIDFEEFIMLMNTNFGNDVTAEDEISEVFERYDPEHTGIVNGKQLSALIGELCGDSIPEAEIQSIVDSAANAASPLGRGHPTPDRQIQYHLWQSLWEAVNEDL